MNTPDEQSGKNPESPAPSDPSQNKDLIRVFDEYGREVFITRQQWAENVLPANLKQVWDDPDELCEMIISALTEGFHSSVVEAAEHLFSLNPDLPRSACVWSITLREEGRLDEAEKILRDFTAKNGENALILTNLAKVYAKRKDDAKVEEILWHAVEVDPNENNAMGWYQTWQQERNGPEAGQAALRRMAALPGSWRPQIWLARAALGAGNLQQAMVYDRQCLARVPKPVPADILMQISGDLGNHNHLSELLELVEPLFDVNFHGLQVGNNLIKAHLDLGQLDAARRINDQLYALNRPDWKQTLGYWDTEIAKAGIAAAPAEAAESLQMSMLSMDNPVWLPASSPALELFPEKSQNEPAVCFLGSTAATPNPSQTIQRQMADSIGRMSRALPLFLAEQIYFATGTSVQTLVPLLMGQGTGFVLSGVPWTDLEAVSQARQATPLGDYIITAHLLAQTEPWKVELRLIRTEDEICMSQLTATLSMGSLTDELPQLAAQLLAALSEHAGIDTIPVPPLYRVPPAPAFSSYLLRLEQLLAVRCATMDGVKPGFLNGEREIIDGNIQLCLDCPDNVITRILLAQTVSTMKKMRPDILPEFQGKLELLEKQKPLAEPGRSIIKRIFDQSEK